MIKRTVIKLTESKTLTLETYLKELDFGKRKNVVILKAECQGSKMRWTWKVPPEYTRDEIKKLLKKDKGFTPEVYLALIIESKDEATRNLMPLLYNDSENLVPLVMDKVVTPLKANGSVEQ